MTRAGKRSARAACHEEEESRTLKSPALYSCSGADIVVLPSPRTEASLLWAEHPEGPSSACFDALLCSSPAGFHLPCFEKEDYREKTKTHVLNLKWPGEGSWEVGEGERWSGQSGPAICRSPTQQDVHGQFVVPEELAGKVFPIFYDFQYQTDSKQKHLSLCQARLCNPSRITSKGTEKSLLYTALFLSPEGDSFNKSVKLLTQCFHNGAVDGVPENCFQRIQLRLCRCLLVWEGRSCVPGEQMLRAVWIEWQQWAEGPRWDPWPTTAGYSSRALQLQALQRAWTKWRAMLLPAPLEGVQASGSSLFISCDFSSGQGNTLIRECPPTAANSWQQVY